MKFIVNKKVIIYICFFVIFFMWNLIVQPLNLDEVWNYGFAHNIYKGLIPYRDFNMVITPFFPFLMSLGFFAFGSNILVLNIENAIILTILVFMLYKLIDKNYLVVVLFIMVPLSVSFSSYNIFIFFILVLLLLMEKNELNDYLIGVILGIGILTKQSVGLCLLFPSLYYFKNSKKILKRIIGVMIPLVIFCIFLFITNSLSDFINLCVLGLFDFAHENHAVFNIYYIVFIIFLFIYLYIIFIKNKKNILNYYCFSFISMMVPLFDTYHTQVAFLSVLLLLFLNYKFDFKINLLLFFFGVIIGVSCITVKKSYDEIVYPNDINHFEYKLIDKESIDFTKEINQFIAKNKDRNIVYLNSNGYYIKLVNDIPINYLDLINRGNWGYNGSEKLYKTIKKINDPIFLVDKNELSEVKQTDKKVIRYVIQNGKKVDSIRMYDVYILK